MSPTLFESLDHSPVASARDSASPSELSAFRVIWVLFALLASGLVMGTVEATPELWGDSLFGRNWIETGRLAWDPGHTVGDAARPAIARATRTPSSAAETMPPA